MDKQIVELTDGVIGVVVPESSYMWTVVGNELLMVPHIGLSSRKKYYDLPPGQWQILGLGDQLSEKQWTKIVKGKVDEDIEGLEYCEAWYPDFENRGVQINDATASGLSLLASKGLKPANTLILKKES